MAREDMYVIGVEGRELNFSKCQLIQNYYELPNLEFLNLDVNELNKKDHGIFDIILCLGLLYHLDNPLSFLETLNKITHEKSLLFIDTHIAPNNQEELNHTVFKDKLTKINSFKHNEMMYEGRWCQESEKGKTPSDEWASVGNYRSFWLTQVSLFKALYQSGFKTINNLYGVFDIDEEFELKKKHNRLWCIASKDS